LAFGSSVLRKKYTPGSVTANAAICLNGRKSHKLSVSGYGSSFINGKKRVLPDVRIHVLTMACHRTTRLVLGGWRRFADLQAASIAVAHVGGRLREDSGVA
jgi:hypothetical protein